MYAITVSHDWILMMQQLEGTCKQKAGMIAENLDSALKKELNSNTRLSISSS